MAGAVILFTGYRYILASNVILGSDQYRYICIPTGSDFRMVDSILRSEKVLKDHGTFARVARLKKYEQKVRPGKYRLTNGMSNNELVNLLRSGRQEPVKLVIRNIRTAQELAGKVAGQIEADSAALLRLMGNKAYLRQYGVSPATVITLFIPNTYKFFWNTSPELFMKRMNAEKDKFWNERRRKKCRDAGLGITDAVILASIIEKETANDSEKPELAGVYINRIKKGWFLQADPTLIYAWNDYTIKRILEKHKKIESPYNTYLHPGLPPGPICLPSIASVDAVLDYRHHSYMYFCAKEDLSGTHNFAVTLAEHNRNARRYREALDRLNIK
jgi:UPF0755 protein